MSGFRRYASIAIAGSGPIRAVLGTGLALLVGSLCLFGDCEATRRCRLLAGTLGEVGTAFSDAGMQWMVFVCTSLYCLGFAVLCRQQAGGGMNWTTWKVSPPSELWLAGLLAAAAWKYLDYTQAVKSTSALSLLGSMALGQAAGLWEGAREKQAEGKECRGIVGGVLIVLLVGAVAWQTEAGYLFRYNGRARWNGPWDNPNTFGVLMGVGVVLAVGSLAERLKAKGQRLQPEPGTSAGSQYPIPDILHPKLRGRLLNALLLMAAAALGVGLVKSYSRGAWVGTIAGLAFLIYQTRNSGNCTARAAKESGRRSRAPTRASLAVSVALLSLGTLGFWGFQHSEGMVTRRVCSMANVNDFSWRKRVAAYEGAMQMLADRPWFGFGWNQPERSYGTFYRQAKVDESGAIQLNDYLMLGMTLGIPALACFGVYLWLALSLGSLPASCNSPMSEADWLKAICRAGAVVLLAGFWLEGGLLKLATGATFWTLLELGRDEPEAARIDNSSRSGRSHLRIS